MLSDTVDELVDDGFVLVSHSAQAKPENPKKNKEKSESTPTDKLVEDGFVLISRMPQARRRQPRRWLRDYTPTEVTKADDPKYITICSSDEENPLSNYSRKIKFSAVLEISQEISKIYEVHGSLLVLCKNRNTAEKFIASKSLSDLCPINATYHTRLNHTKVTIYAPFLLRLSEEEIVETFKEQHVISAYKFQTEYEKGILEPNGNILLTFDYYFVPGTVKVGWRKIKVWRCYPNPLRCKECQLIGRTPKYCTNTPVCAICSLPPHPDHECSRTICFICLADHPPYDSKCPNLLREIEIRKIKRRKHCTIREARSLYHEEFGCIDSETCMSCIISKLPEKKKRNFSYKY